MRTMLDCVAGNQPKACPHPAVAGYLRRASHHYPYAWQDSDWARWPNVTGALPIFVPWDLHNPAADAGDTLVQAHHLGIPLGMPLAVDIEENVAVKPGAAGYVAAWCRAVAGVGYRPVVYTSLSAIGQLGDPAGIWRWWPAHYDGRPVLEPGWAGKQYANPPSSGGPWDLSVIADDLVLWNPHGTAAPNVVTLPDPVTFDHGDAPMITVDLSILLDSQGGWNTVPYPEERVVSAMVRGSDYGYSACVLQKQAIDDHTTKVTAACPGHPGRLDVTVLVAP